MYDTVSYIRTQLIQTATKIDTQGETGVEKTAGSSGSECYSCEVICLRRNIAGI